MSHSEDTTPLVRRVETARGSHIEPPLDQRWSDLEKLRWHAAVVLADSGVRIQVLPGRLSERRFGRWREVPNMFSYSFHNGAGGAMGFGEMWSFLNGVSLGADLARRAVAS